MKVIIAIAVCLVPAAAYAADHTYTNADLAKFQVPGAYTNQDLKGLPPLPTQGARTGAQPPSGRAAAAHEAPAASTAAFQSLYDSVRDERASLLAEIDNELALIDYSESAYAGSPSAIGEPRLGYRAEGSLWIRELRRRVALVDARLSGIEDRARLAGVDLDRR